MLSDRISTLFQILQCSNTDIAKIARCSPSNISRIKSGQRTVSPKSQTVIRLIDAVYIYAEKENMLDSLCELSKAADKRRSTLIPALTLWLFSDKDFVVPANVIPKTRQLQQAELIRFGELLDSCMKTLELSNSKLSAALNIDSSLISRYRNGKAFPYRNEQTRDLLCSTLLVRASRLNRTSRLCSLCGIDEKNLNPETFKKWLFESDDFPSINIAKTLITSIESFIPGGQNQFSEEKMASVLQTWLDRKKGNTENAAPYWGTKGLRDAVVRFLTDVSEDGEELLLFSDEAMEWMSGDPEYFFLWAYLMTTCLKKGIHIKIIHNIDRSSAELVNAVIGWLPLYISGQIEPYVLAPEQNAIFRHTFFLNRGKACIYGFFPFQADDNRWYEYITDKERLIAAQVYFQTMLSKAELFLRTFPLSKAGLFRDYCINNQGKDHTSILFGLSAETIPIELLEKILRRTGLKNSRIEEILTVFNVRKQLFDSVLANGDVNEIVYLPDSESVNSGMVRLNLDADLLDTPIFYTSEEYSDHIKELRRLIKNEPHYHFTLLPFAPFQKIQVHLLKNSVSILQNKDPYTSFVFTNKLLTTAVSDYARFLIDKYGTDRLTTYQALLLY